MKNNVVHPLKPLIFKDSEILILGSFPSVKSRDNMFFYMHPQNRFWKILSALYDDDFVSCDIDEKINLCKKHKIAIEMTRFICYNDFTSLFVLIYIILT